MNVEDRPMRPRGYWAKKQNILLSAATVLLFFVSDPPNT